MPDMPQPGISIIGAGLSGLVLGRCLLRRGIPSIIYDRDDAATGVKRHNYGITLSPNAFRPMLKALELNEDTFRKTMAVDSAVDGSGRVRRSFPRDDGPSGPIRVNRRKLEHMLRDGLDVRWEHSFASMATNGSTKTLDFSNGRQVQGSIIVGADGVHSMVRKIVLSERAASPAVLPFVVYNGKRRISLETFASMYCVPMDRMTVIECQHGRTLLRITIDDIDDTRVSLSYTYSRPARRNDPLFNPGRATTGAKTIPDELFDEVAALPDLMGPFKDIFDPEKMRSDRLLNWLMRSVTVEQSDLATAADDGVLLLGDTAHATPILGGSGADAAIVDGVKLADYIAENGTDRLASFCDEQYATWWKGVKVAEAGLAKMHAENKPSL